MKYLKLYEGFITEEDLIDTYGIEGSLDKGKKFILLSGPSASGKTYLASQKGVVHWYEDLNADKILIGTDNFGGDNQPVKKALEKLLFDNGLVELSKSFKTYEDSPWLMELYEDYYKQWQETASEEEKAIYSEIREKIGYTTEPDPKAKSQQTKGHDGRRFGLAWVAYFTKAKTIVFDDIDTGIKEFKIFPIDDYLIFTPLDWYVKNIESRNHSKHTAEHIDINNKNTAFYQYCNWFRATDKPDLDDKKYTAETVEKMILGAGHKNPKEILDLLGVTEELKNGFYLTTAPNIDPNEIYNSRDKSTGRAKDASALSF